MPLKGMNADTDRFSRVGLVARMLSLNLQFGVRAHMSNAENSAQQGLHFDPVAMGLSGHKGVDRRLLRDGSVAYFLRVMRLQIQLNLKRDLRLDADVTRIKRVPLTHHHPKNSGGLVGQRQKGFLLSEMLFKRGDLYKTGGIGSLRLCAFITADFVPGINRLHK